jgi:vancomycin resistance protein YoaR
VCGPAKGESPVILTDGVKSARVTHAQLGARKEGPIWKFDFDKLMRTLKHIAPRFARPGRNARVAATTGRVKIIPSSAARMLDVSASAHRIAATIEKNPRARSIRLVVVKRSPAVPTGALKPIRGVLSRFTTHFNAGNKKRAHNVRLAASRLDGKILWPAKTLSLNEIVRERTQKNGFLTATVL